MDCEVKETLLLNRKPGSTFNLAGAIVVGAQITPDQYYDVSLIYYHQILLIIIMSISCSVRTMRWELALKRDGAISYFTIIQSNDIVLHIFNQ